VTEPWNKRKSGNGKVLQIFNLESFPPDSLGGYGGKRTRHAACVPASSLLILDAHAATHDASRLSTPFCAVLLKILERGGKPFLLRHGETVQLFSNLGHMHLYLLDWDPHTAVYPASLRLNPGTRLREMERGSRHAPPGWRDEVQPYLRHVGSWMDVERSTALLKHLCRLACGMGSRCRMHRTGA